MARPPKGRLSSVSTSFVTATLISWSRWPIRYVYAWRNDERKHPASQARLPAAGSLGLGVQCHLRLHEQRSEQHSRRQHRWTSRDPTTEHIPVLDVEAQPDIAISRATTWERGLGVVVGIVDRQTDRHGAFVANRHPVQMAGRVDSVPPGHELLRLRRERLGLRFEGGRFGLRQESVDLGEHRIVGRRRLVGKHVAGVGVGAGRWKDRRQAPGMREQATGLDHQVTAASTAASPLRARERGQPTRLGTPAGDLVGLRDPLRHASSADRGGGGRPRIADAQDDADLCLTTSGMSCQLGRLPAPARELPDEHLEQLLGFASDRIPVTVSSVYIAEDRVAECAQPADRPQRLPNSATWIFVLLVIVGART